MNKRAIDYALNAPTGGVSLTGGRFLRAFENNIAFLNGFDVNRMLYWFRVHAGKPAPGAPYAAGDGHFENNLHGQTAGEFLMGAGATLWWREDRALREKVRAVISELNQYREPDGFLLPVDRDTFLTREYPNYTRAWLTFGLLDAGAAGESDAYRLARGMGDAFNESEVLPYVKDLNLGFQGILANTRLYDSPVGVEKDIEIAMRYYQEDWWLDWLIRRQQRAIYMHPGNHPHSTLLTSLEGYLDLYRFTGKARYLSAVKNALSMYEEKWQHVGGGINMCENDAYYPGCNWLSPNHNYNELCSTNFWVLLNQRMHLLEPDDAHYVDEMENSLYNVLLAAQVGSRGYHYLNFLQQTKDWRYLDRATCCAALGCRLTAILPQFLYSYSEDTVSVDIYAPSVARLPNGAAIEVETELPDGENTIVRVLETAKPITLKLRIPRWTEGGGRYEIHENVRAGAEFRLRFPMRFRATKYTGGEEIAGKERWAIERGPLLYAVLGAPNPLTLRFNPESADEWLIPQGNRLRIRGDDCHEYRAYLDIDDEPFDVYPIVERG